MDDKQKRAIEKFARNTVGKDLHEPMAVDDIRTILDERGDEWRLVWESIPTDGVFDSLYAEAGKYEAFLYDAQYLLVRQADRPGIKSWFQEDDALTWMIENPPFEELVPIATLFTHSQGIVAGASPWLLFQYVIGTAVTTQGMGLNSLMGIGHDDGKYLGEALASWGEHEATAVPYIELLLMFGGEEG